MGKGDHPDSTLPLQHPMCQPCIASFHERCGGCKGCGCYLSSVSTAAAGPKLPDPKTYR